MKTQIPFFASEVVDHEWVTFPGGELDGKRPKVRCLACRAQAGPSRTICFQCYRAAMERERALMAAAEIDTATEARFAATTPFEPVDRARLSRLRGERAAVRAATSRFVNRRREAQIAARHALAEIAAGVRARELQLPESWLPFVVSR